MNQRERYAAVIALVRKGERAWQPLYAKMTDDAEFLLGGKHYKDRANAYDSGDIRWVGEEAVNRWRHEVAMMTDAPEAIVARTLESDDDPEMMERVVAFMESRTESPSREFADVCEDFVGASSAVGLSYATLDELPDEGRWGGIYPRFLDPRCVMRDPDAKSVHSPRCKFLIIRERVSKAEARKRCGASRGKWSASAVAKCTPHEDNEAVRTGEVSALLMLDQSDASGTLDWSDDDEFTVYYVWERRPKDLKREPDAETYREYEDAERYMACASPTCGHKSEPQGEDIDGDGLPDLAACPACGDVMQRIDGAEDEAIMLAYPKGRLTVVAPDAGADKALYEGKWPVEYRSYPVMELMRFRHPFELVGPSLTDLTRWNQIATDMVMRLALERMVQSAPFWVLPRVGLTDWSGQPFQMSDENGWAAFYEGDTMPLVDMKEGTGIPAAWNAVYNAAKSALSQHTGQSDFGLSPGQSRDIPASSVSQQIHQQEIPLAHYRRRYQRAKAMFLGLWYDAERAAAAEAMPTRLRQADGTDMVHELNPADLPNAEFFLSDTPDMTAMDESKQKAVAYMLELMKVEPPEVVVAAMQELKFPMATVRRIIAAYSAAKEQAMQEQQAAMDAQAGAMMPPPDAVPPEGEGDMDPRQMVEQLLGGMGPQ